MFMFSFIKTTSRSTLMNTLQIKTVRKGFWMFTSLWFDESVYSVLKEFMNIGAPFIWKKHIVHIYSSIISYFMVNFLFLLLDVFILLLFLFNI